MAARPQGTNADEWRLFLTHYLDSRTSADGLSFVAVQIAEAIEAERSRCAAMAQHDNSKDPKAPQRLYVVPKSSRQPRTGTGIPADVHMHPAGCPDADWCRDNRFCYWHCQRRNA
jgi:hypothetical protein